MDGMAGLPPEAQPDVDAAASALRKGLRTQFEVFAVLRHKLKAKGIEPPSFTDFNRWCIRLMTTPKTKARR